MTSARTRHLVTVWNPSIAANAMDDHLFVLRTWSDRHDDGKADDEALYVWWGKVKSPNRQQPMAHLADVRAAAEVARAGTEVQLYITDYRALYVAEVLDVASELGPGEKQHVPVYYAQGDMRCDLWFKLGDIRRLVTDDTLQVVEELKKLSNVHYNDRPVSIYGGMVDLPLVVTRADERRFFDADEREALTDGALWAEFDAEAGAGIAAMERELRENRFGESLWSALEPGARTFVATGERLYREHRLDPSFDFAPVLGSFSKAIEVQVNALLRRVLPALPREVRLMNVDGRTEDLAERTQFGLHQLVNVLAGDQRRSVAISRALEHGAWLTDSFAVVLDQFRHLRNAGTHESVVDRKAATHWRNQMIGVGCVGHLVELAKVRSR
ncbi:MAG: hypothetical protein ABIV10_05035 [Gemmatimonadaceae bacterium]